YYAKMHDMNADTPWGLNRAGADIYKVHVATKRTVQLTHGERTPNTGIVSAEKVAGDGVFNLGPCPVPGGRIMFTSNRNGFTAPKGYTNTTMQLFVMDEDGGNVDMIGHL